MKTRLLLFGFRGLACLLLALNFLPLSLYAGEKSKATERQPSGIGLVRYDIEIVNGQLQLSNLRDRINVNARWGPGNVASVDATLRNLVEVLRDLHPNVNIVMAPGIERVKIANLKLHSTQLENELEALRVASGNKFTWMIGGGPGADVPRGGMSPMAGIDPATGLPIRPSTANNSDEIPLFVLSPSTQPAEGNRTAEVFNLGPYFQQLGDVDQKEKDEALKRIQEIVLNTMDQMQLNDPEDRPGFQFHPGANLLIVIGRPEAREIARKVIGALQSPGSVGVSGEVPVAGGYGGGFGGWAGVGGAPGAANFPNAFGAASKGRRTLMTKLDNIRLESVSYDGLPLSEVVRNLVDESKKRDPEKRGVNFLIHAAQPASDATDLNTVAIRIVPPLSNVRLSDVLDAIVKSSEHPIRYSITDYAVVFSSKEPDDLPGAVPLPPGYAPR